MDNLVKQLSKCKINLDRPTYFSNIDEMDLELFKAQGFKTQSNYIQLDENTIQIIRSICVHKYKNSFKLRKLNNDALSTLSSPNIKQYSKIYNLQIKKSKIFLNSLFTLHDIHILKDGYKFIVASPFNIKIYKKYEDMDYAELKYQSIYNSDKLTFIFCKIYLPKILSPIIPLLYTHEIIHTQVYGNIENIFNNEVLPIFVELLYKHLNNNKQLNNQHNYSRISTLIDCIDSINNNYYMDYNLLQNTTFYVSIITAYKLFDIYVNSNSLIQKEIINRIQSILNGSNTLESVLDKYDLGWSKVKKRDNLIIP